MSFFFLFLVYFGSGEVAPQGDHSAEKEKGGEEWWNSFILSAIPAAIEYSSGTPAAEMV